MRPEYADSNRDALEHAPTGSGNVFDLIIAPLNAGADDVLSSLQTVGVTLANFSYVFPETVLTATSTQQQLVWYFSLPVPLSKISSTVTALSSIQKSNPNLQLSFSIQSLQASPAQQAVNTCPESELLSDAQAQAQQMAAAAGLTLGPVQALANQTPVQGIANAQVVLEYPAMMVASQVGTVVLLNPYQSAVGCTLVVQFGLLRY